MPKIPTAQKAALEPVSVATRLKPFGLHSAKLQMTNLEVPANQTVVLDRADRKFAKQVVQLAPKTIDDLKAWIGVPDAAFVQAPAPAPIVHSMSILPVHDNYTLQESTTLHAVARDYIFGN